MKNDWQKIKNYYYGAIPVSIFALFLSSNPLQLFQMYIIIHPLAGILALYLKNKNIL